MDVASSRGEALAIAVVAGCWDDVTLDRDIEGVGEEATCCCRD